METNFVHDFLKVEFGAPHLTAFLCCEKCKYNIGILKIIKGLTYF